MERILKRLYIKRILIYGVVLALLMLLLKWLEHRFMVVDHTFEIYAGAIALLFTALGVWLTIQLGKPKTVVVEKEVMRPPEPPNEMAAEKLHLSKRELEVLQLMALGLSNQEIAGQLFVSLNTIKTHTANLYLKLDVKRRTQAVQKAKQLNIIQ